jgi:hypothetical protein
MLSLEFMYLFDNALTGSIPSTLGSLSLLELLWLYGTNMPGSVPQQLCHLVETNGLDLAINCELVECDCGCRCG